MKVFAFASVMALGACASHEEVGRSEQAVTTTTCVVLQRGTNGSVADTMLSNPPQGNNFGALPIVRVGAKDEGLLRFDVGFIPNTAVINSSTLTIFINGSVGTAPIAIHNVTSSWDESTTTYASFGQGFDLPASAIISPSSPSAFKSTDVTALTQSWVVGTRPNYGVLLDTTSKKDTIFVSSDGAAVAQRPALRVCYTLPPEDHCAGSPCEHGGTCTNQESGYTCECPAGYTGARCETVVDNCADNPCQNGGACQSSQTGFTCTCPTGFTGERCETLIDHCAGDPCAHGGTCTNNFDGFQCACPIGYVGQTCEDIVDSCADAPCQNGGSCTNGIGTYTCSCPTGYAGANCEVVVDHCTPGACQNGGTCVNNLIAYTCACAPGYSGSSCETQIDDCAAAPCQNGGTCIDGIASYSCACAPGYSGDNCEVDIDECAAMPCHNGGLCIDGIDGFTCQCAGAYYGSTCDELPSDPCLAAGGTLAPLNGSYTITNAASLAALLCVNQITGTLTINTDASVPSVDLPSLTRVGALTIASTARSSTITLGALQMNDGSLTMSSNPFVTSIDVSNATLHSLIISNDSNLTTLKTGTFVELVQDVFIQNAPLLADLGPNGLSSVRHIDRDFTVQSTALASLGPNGISGLISVARSLSLINNPSLASLGPTSLANLISAGSAPYNGGGIALQGSPLLTSVDASNATTWGITIANEPNLTTFRTGPFNSRVGDIFIQNAPLLSDLGPNGVSSVRTVDRDFTVQSTALASLGPTGISGLVSVGRSLALINNAALASLGPTSLVNLASVGSAPYNGGGITLQGSPLITSVDASNATTWGMTLVNDANLTTFRTGVFNSRVGDIIIQSSPLLSDLGPNGMSAVRTVDRDFTIQSSALSSLGPTGISGLVSVGRSLALVNNASLSSLGPTSLINLTSVGSAPYNGGGITFQGSPLITAVDTSNATTWGLAVTNNANLATFRTGSFATHATDVLFQNNPVLADLGANGLNGVRIVDRDLIIATTALGTLGTTGLSNLVSVGRSFFIEANPQLTSVASPNLASLTSVGSTPLGGGDLRLDNDPLLTAFEAPALTTIRSALRVDRNQTLATLRFNSLTTIGTNLVITNNPALPTCFADLLAQLVGFTGTVTISGNGSVCP